MYLQKRDLTAADLSSLEITVLLYQLTFLLNIFSNQDHRLRYLLPLYLDMYSLCKLNKTYVVSV